MSQVEAILGVKILTPIRPGIEGIRRPPGDGPLLGEQRLPSKDAANPGTVTSPDIDGVKKLKDAFSRGWSVIVWNDPVNLMDYVV